MVWKKNICECFSIIFILSEKSIKTLHRDTNDHSVWLTSMEQLFNEFQYDLRVIYGHLWLSDPMTMCGQFGFLQLSRFWKDMFSIFSKDPTLLLCLAVAVIWMESNDVRNYIETTLFSQLQYKCELILTYNRAVIVH